MSDSLHPIRVPSAAARTTDHPYADFVAQVDKPARYLGGEFQSVRKAWDSVSVRLALAFPDVYEIGMSHLGTKILYSLLNKHPSILCERAFTPWVDMEAQLRQRGLPLYSLESARPLRDFDVVGMSLQYELTYTNCLTLLDLGGIPLRAADRGDTDPLIIGGGPTATHPEPVAPFFDCFLVGEAEDVLPDLLLLYAELKRAGLNRRERLIRLSARGAIYVPELYRTEFDPKSQRVVVTGPIELDAPTVSASAARETAKSDGDVSARETTETSADQAGKASSTALGERRIPHPVLRSWVPDLNRFPFPADAPVPYAEAIFDRVSVEIARGCTDGCRFCQAGMIYRPVRERDPEAIVDAVVAGIKNGGYDETSLTSLSTADFSCILPLMKKVMARLRQEKVSLSVSSLRAYGLNPEILDEMASVRATGLTFAPEAGTQRMRDVINKNITEDDITQSAENIFSRGWSRMKCYFMIGLPTETMDDVAGIAQTGGRLRRLGKKLRHDADVTVSVSSHVPKPHTPFQWCAQDTSDEIAQKQSLLRELCRRDRVEFRHHDRHQSWVEGILSRGDRPLADVIERAWRKGARFDSWDDQFSLQRWEESMAECGIDPTPYFMTLPVDARLPWDHIDVGLEDGFLLSEYRKALKNRLSPPCGKPYGSLLHHNNLEDALSDGRKLVCYDCGVACDLTAMREDRLVALRKLGADRRPPPPLSNEERRREILARRAEKTPPAAQDSPPVSADSPPAPVASSVPGPVETAVSTTTTTTTKGGGLQQAKPQPAFAQSLGHSYRIRYRKVGRAAFIAHLDTMRLLARMLRRAGVEMIYTRGFHPKPDMSFGPALGLGVSSLAEIVDMRLESVASDGETGRRPLSAAELAERLSAAAPEGFVIDRVVLLPDGAPALSRLIDSTEFALVLPDGDMPPDLSNVATWSSRPLVVQRRSREHREVKDIDVGRYLLHAQVLDAEAAAALRDRLHMHAANQTPTAMPGPVLVARLRVVQDGGAKPGEVAEALLDFPPPPGTRYARVALCGPSGADLCDLVLPPLRPSPAPRAVQPQAAESAS